MDYTPLGFFGTKCGDKQQFVLYKRGTTVSSLTLSI